MAKIGEIDASLKAPKFTKMTVGIMKASGSGRKTPEELADAIECSLAEMRKYRHMKDFRHGSNSDYQRLYRNGLIPEARQYFSQFDIDAETAANIDKLIDLIIDEANELPLDIYREYRKYRRTFYQILLDNGYAARFDKQRREFFEERDSEKDVEAKAEKLYSDLDIKFDENGNII